MAAEARPVAAEAPLETRDSRVGGQQSKSLPFPAAFAFVASGCLLVLELVAGRILAPVVGVSLYTWTSVIGVVLAGLSLGNWIGGKIADRRPERSTLAVLLVLSAAASALILLFADNLESIDAPHSWSTTLQVVWVATVVFFVPSVLLGTPVPIIVKLVLGSLDATGRVVGRIQAASTVGSIIAVFLTGFVLISEFGTRAIVGGVAITLGVLAALVALASPLDAVRRRVRGAPPGSDPSSETGFGDRVRGLLARVSPRIAARSEPGGDGALRVVREPLPMPAVFAFFGSGCLLVLELVAGRMLAPVVGVSLFTWTSVIGTVLAGLSLGNWIGGKIADRWPGRRTLALLYLVAAAASALILIFARDLHAVDAPRDWSAIMQVLWLTVLLFFLPSVMLGTPTPMIVKLTLDSLTETGQVVGRVQAAATLGSIVGVFATGFLLISAFGTRAVVAGVVVTLILLAFFSHPLSARPRAFGADLVRSPQWAVLGIAIAAVAVGFSAGAKSECLRESDYFCIDVVDNPSGIREMRLDLLIHGEYDPRDPFRLVYDYEQLYGEITAAAFKRTQQLDTFTMGGGAYSFPRYLDRFYRSNNLVAEIDPEVTATAREHFGLRDSQGIEIVHDDARPVLRDRPAGERYDLVLADAFNDITVPYHLTTREFNEMIRDHLKPRGLFLANVIDGVDYDFLRSYMKTLKETFPSVGMATVRGQALDGERATVVVVSGNGPLPRMENLYPYDYLVPFIERGETVTLTDDHVPVDQLLAPVFSDSLKVADG